MPLLLLLALALAGLTSSCSSPGSDPAPRAEKSAHAGIPVWWSSSELNILRISDIDRELAKPLENGITVTDAAKEKGLVSDCATARELQAQGYAAQYPRDIAALGILTAKCLALDALKTARPAARSEMPQRPYTPQVLEFLPAALAPALTGVQQRAVERATQKGDPLRVVEMTVGFEAARDEEIHIQGEGWQETLVLLGKADFDGDSVQDWLLRADLAIERGTYRNSRLFLLSRNSPDAVIAVKRELKP